MEVKDQSKEQGVRGNGKRAGRTSSNEWTSWIWGVQPMKNKQGSGHTEMENSLIPHFLHAVQMCPDLCAKHSAIKFPLRTEILGQDGIYPGGVQTLPGSLG